MHQHDQDLIMALAEGTLEPDAAEAARAEIDACATCRVDLDMQVSGLAALAALPAAGLSELESARLHRALRAELGITTETRPEPARRWSRMPLAALGTAAAILVAVVLIAPALNLIGGGASSGDGATIAADAALTTTTAASAAAELDAAVPEAGGAERATTPAPNATTTVIEQVQGTSGDEEPIGYFTTPQDLDEIYAEASGLGFDEIAVRDRMLQQAEKTSVGTDEATSCISVTLSSDPNFVGAFEIARGTVDGRLAIYVIYLAEQPADSVLILHAADDCAELGRAGGNS